MLTLFVQWLVPFVCGGVITLLGTLVGMWRREQARASAVKLGLQSLLRAEIIRSFEEYKNRRYCPIYAREAIKREYDSYHLLGGNDVVTNIFHQIMELPTSPLESDDRGSEK